MWIRWCSQQNQFVCSNPLWIQAHKPQGAPTALLRSVDALEKATEVLDREYQQCEAIKAQVSKLPTLKDASSIEQSLGINNTMFKSMLWKSCSSSLLWSTYDFTSSISIQGWFNKLTSKSLTRLWSALTISNVGPNQRSWWSGWLKFQYPMLKKVVGLHCWGAHRSPRRRTLPRPSFQIWRGGRSSNTFQ
jgi:hypothetical protein